MGLLRICKHSSRGTVWREVLLRFPAISMMAIKQFGDCAFSGSNSQCITLKSVVARNVSSSSGVLFYDGFSHLS